MMAVHGATVHRLGVLLGELKIPNLVEVSPPARPGRSRDEDGDLQKAIEESMRMQDDEARRRSRRTKEEDDLAKALRDSEDDESKRKRDLESTNANALFDDNLNL